MVMPAPPTGIVLITSVASAARLRFPPPGFSLQWYHALFFASPEIVDAALASLKVAAVATIAGTMPATAAAIAITEQLGSCADTGNEQTHRELHSPTGLFTSLFGSPSIVLRDRLDPSRCARDQPLLTGKYRKRTCWGSGVGSHHRQHQAGRTYRVRIFCRFDVSQSSVADGNYRCHPKSTGRWSNGGCNNQIL
jgi:hypothetical protein